MPSEGCRCGEEVSHLGLVADSGKHHPPTVLPALYTTVAAILFFAAARLVSQSDWKRHARRWDGERWTDIFADGLGPSAHLRAHARDGHRSRFIARRGHAFLPKCERVGETLWRIVGAASLPALWGRGPFALGQLDAGRRTGGVRDSDEGEGSPT